MDELRDTESSNQTRTENREQRADVLLRFLNIAENIEPFHGQKIETVFSDEEHRREFIENLSPEGFLQLLNGLNGILRGKKKEDWGMDGEGVGLNSPLISVGYVAPRQEDKTELLTEVLLSAKTMCRAGRDLKDIALLVSSSLNAIHPYLDANGRGSRLIYLLITEGFNEGAKKEIRAVLSKYGREKIDIDPGFVQADLDELVRKEVGVDNPELNPEKMRNLFRSLAAEKPEFGPEVSRQDINLILDLYRDDSQYLFWSVFTFFRDNPDLDRQKFIEQHPKRSAIMVNKLVENLSQEQITRILQNYGYLKKRYVEKLIDAIANPEKEEYQIKDGEQKIPLKTYFENRIKEEQERRA